MVGERRQQDGLEIRQGLGGLVLLARPVEETRQVFAQPDHAPVQGRVSSHPGGLLEVGVEILECLNLFGHRRRHLAVGGCGGLFEEKGDILEDFDFLILLAGHEGGQGDDLLDLGQGFEFGL